MSEDQGFTGKKVAVQVAAAQRFLTHPGVALTKHEAESEEDDGKNCTWW